MITIIHGPQGCGKTNHAAALAAHFGCASVVDPWDGVSSLPADALALTNSLPAVVEDGIHVMDFDTACRVAGITRS